MPLKTKVRIFLDNQAFFYFFTAVVILAFLLLSFNLAHTVPSRLDEGAFMVKGYYYWTGKYAPFQDYGPWTNNMPLAYYVPGFAQYVFGPGLQPGRYFAIFLTFLNFLALFLLMKRLTNKWWALLAVTPFAVNPALLMVYVQTISEGVAACLLSWSLFFLIGKERTVWQIAPGAFLSALTVLTRQNMIFIVPFVIIYVFWLHGKKPGLIATACLSIPLIVVHAIFYPNIFTLWLTWLPGFIKDFINIGPFSIGGVQRWRPDVEFFDRISSFTLTFRYQLISFLFLFTSLVLLPIKNAWKSNFDRVLVFLLSITYLVFFGMHAWASLGKNYCVFCLSNYIAFFIPLAVVAGAISLRMLVEYVDNVSTSLVVSFVLLMCPAVLVGGIETIGRQVMEIPFPRFKGGRLAAGTTELWTVFRNRFGMEYDQLLRIIPPAFGLFVSLLFIVFSVLLFSFLRKRISIQLGKFILIEVLVISFILTPTHILGQDNFGNSCGGDVLKAYETAGRQLRSVIPPGSKLFWNGGSVVTPLVYLTDNDIHPPQLNGIYSFREGGDRFGLEKIGFYNQQSIDSWKESDEFFIVANMNIRDSQVEFFNPDEFHEYERSEPIDPCSENSFFRVFVRKDLD